MSAGWPDWIPDKNRLAELARYVSPFAVGELGLIPPGLGARRPDPGGEYLDVAIERLTLLYKWLQSKRIALYEPPWSQETASAGIALRTQRIRPPAEAVRGPATHLDIALVFAAMLLSADVRAFLLFSKNRLVRPLICADLRMPLANESAQAPNGFSEWTATLGLFTSRTDQGKAARAVKRLTPDRGWIVVDPSLAMFRSAEQIPFETASGKGLLAGLDRSAALEDTEWYLADVHRLRNAAVPYEPPHGLAVPAIFSYLPSAPRFVEYESRRKLVADLAVTARPGGPPTVLVLHGPHGIGKSRLALRLAAAADFGYGWMLNAANAGTLRASLARAQAGDHSYADDVSDPASVRALAGEALHRLNGSEAPWVVILDNCDSPPEAAGLKPLIPRPHARGQLLIMTTSHEGWLPYGADAGWETATVPSLTDGDLQDLDIPELMRAAVAGRPLIAQILNAVGRSTEMAEDLRTHADDGPPLAWELFLRAAPGEGAVRLARTMAWCPADPVRLGSVLATPYPRADRSDADELARCQLVSFTELTDSPAIAMHQLIAQAIHHQTWRDEPAAAAEITRSLVRTDIGRVLFTEASDSTALATLASDVQIALRHLPDTEHGLLWHGLGVIRERRGPVRESKPFFGNAVRLLDRAERPYETAESLIGRARVVFQTAASAAEELRTAQSDLALAAELVAPLTDVAARQLKERGNALSLLINRRMADGIVDPGEREAKLRDLLELTWRSYEQRVRISAGLPDDAPVGRHAPLLEWGLDADRAYFNLAGFYIELAKSAMHNSKNVRDYLEQAGSIYSNCRRLREERYKGRDHPHLAACIHGEAIVAYFRAGKLAGERHQLVDAAERISSALTMRSHVASAFASTTLDEILDDGDVQKSASLLMKVAIASRFCRGREQTNPYDEIRETFVEVFKEMTPPAAES